MLIFLINYVNIILMLILFHNKRILWT